MPPAVQTSEHPGFHLALLGIDFVGKEAILDELERMLSRAGRRVQTISWAWCASQANQWPRTNVQRYPYNELYRYWVEFYKSFLSGGTLIDQNGDAISAEHIALLDLSVDARRRYHASGLRTQQWLTTMSLKIAAHVLIYNEVISSFVDRGFTVLEGSNGFEAIAKECLAYWLGDAATSNKEEPEWALSYSSNMFGRHYAPDMGVFLRGDPERAVSLANLDTDQLLFESLSGFGQEPRASFISLQAECNNTFASFALAHDWYVPDLVGPYDSNQCRYVAQAIFDRVVARG